MWKQLEQRTMKVKKNRNHTERVLKTCLKKQNKKKQVNTLKKSQHEHITRGQYSGMKRKNLSTENIRLLAHLHSSLAPTRTLPLKRCQVRYEIPLTAQLIVFVCLMTQNWTSINPCGADVSGSSPARQQDEQRADSVLRPRECLRHAVWPPVLFFLLTRVWLIFVLQKLPLTFPNQRSVMVSSIWHAVLNHLKDLKAFVKWLNFKLRYSYFYRPRLRTPISNNQGQRGAAEQMSLFTAIFIKDPILWPPFESLCFSMRMIQVQFSAVSPLFFLLIFLLQLMLCCDKTNVDATNNWVITCCSLWHHKGHWLFPQQRHMLSWSRKKTAGLFFLCWELTLLQTQWDFTLSFI